MEEVGGGWSGDEWVISAALAGETKGHRFGTSTPVAVMKLFKNVLD